MTPQTDPCCDPELLASLNMDVGHCAVVGLQWGDEGKGKVVDLLASQLDLVVRYNGGANAGHSVQVGDKRYALHLIPSGILSADAINVLGNGVVIDPAQIVKEINGLRAEGITIGDNIKISDRAHLVFEYHKVQDVLYDQALAKAMGGTAAIGTTGRGIGPCYADKALRSMAIRVGDLLDEAGLRAKLQRIITVKNTVLAALAKQCDQAFEPFSAEAVLKDTLALAQVLRPHICDSAHLLHTSMDAGKRLLFEGANATLLDIDHGTYPFVTSSNCSSLGVHTGTGVPGHKVTNILGIVKAYQTRVGGGPMPTELNDATAERIREVGKEFGTTTGRPRRVGWLDLVALKYTAQLSGATGIALMLVDVLSGLPELKLCTSYEHDGKTLENFPADAGVLDSLTPVYETVPGFEENVEECKRFDDLPDNARAYIRRIEKFVGVPVVMVSVGPRRDQTVLRD
jgi:adenylosuccinate synthase